MNGQITSSAHSALQYIISKAMLEGKIGTTTIEIPMTDLYTAHEGPAFNPEASGLVLRLKITTTWEQGDEDGDFSVDTEGDIGLEDDFLADGDEDDEGSNNGFN